MKRTTLVILFTAILAVGMVANTAHAAIMYAADFNSSSVGHTGNYVTSADYSNGALIGQDAWVLTNSTVNPLTVSNAGTDGVVAMTNNGQDDRATFSAITLGATSSAQMFMAADINLSAAQGSTTGDYFLSLGDGGTSTFYSRVYAKVTTGGYALALLNFAAGPLPGVTDYGATLSFGTTYHIVAEYDLLAGSNNDTGTLYVDTTNTNITGGTFYATGVVGTSGSDQEAHTIAAVYLRQGNASTAPTLTSIDNITVVPEPASIVLIGLGLIGCVGAARYCKTGRVKQS